MEAGSYFHVKNFANDKHFGLVYMDHRDWKGINQYGKREENIEYHYHKHPQVPFCDVGM